MLFFGSFSLGSIIVFVIAVINGLFASHAVLPGVEQERFFINHLPQTEWNIPLPGDLTISMKAFESLIGRDNEEISSYYQGQCYFMDNIVSNRKVM